MNDPYNLQRFIDAQRDIYETALGELQSGAKQSHWMWFIFPQLSGLGHSPTAKFFAIRSAAEGRAYLDHPLLGRRLRECVEAVLPWSASRSAEQIFGEIDSMKLRSSLTLFARLEPEAIFASGLCALFDSVPDETTLALLNAGR
ncbi:MAG TPA: DUF1810 domain-containing protein [Sphingomicrobium sp.]|nr:DUF1810 domain-containing protein [Sphingomicrobium sp.]